MRLWPRPQNLEHSKGNVPVLSAVNSMVVTFDPLRDELLRALEHVAAKMVRLEPEEHDRRQSSSG